MDELHLQRKQRATRGPGRSAAREQQALDHAREAMEAVRQRRAKQSGAAAWVSDRSSRWTLDGTAHDALMATPVLGSYFRRMGVLPAAPDSITAALAAGRDVALCPGGERDSLRPWTERDVATPAGRMGFIKVAIRSGVPIVPIATVGGPDSMPVLATGKRLARWLALDRDPSRARDQNYVERVYGEVESAMQDGMDALVRWRRLPLFG
jgi:1-acyl-sn-glycerol-3-phosphate acyltransferase